MTEQQEITKKIILFNKTLFDCSYNTMEIAQDHTEKISNLLMEHSPWFPEKGKELIADYTQQFKKNREGFKKVMDDHFNASI